LHQTGRWLGRFAVGSALLGLVLAVAGAAIAAVLPANASFGERILLGILGALAGIVVLVFVVFVLAFGAVPYQQRSVLAAEVRSLRTRLAVRPPRNDPEAISHRAQMVALVQSLPPDANYALVCRHGHVSDSEPYQHLYEHLGDDLWIRELQRAVAGADLADRRVAAVKRCIANEIRITLPEPLDPVAWAQSTFNALFLPNISFEPPNFVREVLDRQRTRSWIPLLKSRNKRVEKVWRAMLASRPRAEDLRESLRRSECSACLRDPAPAL